MGDVNNNLSLFFQLLDHFKQTVNFCVAEACRRLIKTDYFQVFPAVCLHDLHHLLIGNAQILYLCSRLDRKSKIPNNLSSHLIRLACVDHAKPVCRHTSQINVFCHTQFQKNLSLLIDYADPFLNCLMGRVKMFLDSVQQIFSLCRLIITIQHFQKCGFSGSVLT